jgi:ABC-type ATPase involved in cell division
VIIASHDTGLIQSMQMPTLNLIAGQIDGTTGVSDAQ